MGGQIHYGAGVLLSLLEMSMRMRNRPVGYTVLFLDTVSEFIEFIFVRDILHCIAGIMLPADRL